MKPNLAPTLNADLGTGPRSPSDSLIDGPQGGPLSRCATRYSYARFWMVLGFLTLTACSTTGQRLGDLESSLRDLRQENLNLRAELDQTKSRLTPLENDLQLRDYLDKLANCQSGAITEGCDEVLKGAKNE